MTTIKLSPISTLTKTLPPSHHHQQVLSPLSQSTPTPTPTPTSLPQLVTPNPTLLKSPFGINYLPLLDHSIRFSSSFFLFGLLNNVLYVIIISAALDLVPSTVPTGVVLGADIAPSLIVKMGWPYLVKGQVQYPQRIMACSILSFVGMMVIVFSNSVVFRLLGISLASISSGLGEMTFLQLTTRYEGLPGVSWFASGTGAAGILGAGLWWILRSLGIRIGLGLSSILPICLSITYFLLLPNVEQIQSASNEERGDYRIIQPETNGDQEQQQEEEEGNDNPPNGCSSNSGGGDNNLTSQPLSLAEKISLTKPLLLAYMLPLFTVYFAEYTINTGVAPTLLYPPPKPESNPIFSRVFKSLKDYYPFWQLTYQTFVFFSRSSMAIFKFPALPKRFIGMPSVMQMMILATVLLESSYSVLSRLVSMEWIFVLIFLVISLEGVCGGLAYVSAYYWLGRDDHLLAHPLHVEFRMACVGFADTLGILFASVFSSWLEPRLCGVQVSRGRLLCKQVSQ